MPKFSEFAFGKKGKAKQLSTIDPMQKQLIDLVNEGLSSGEGPFGELFGEFDQEGFEAGVTKPALKQFQEEILPQLNEKFIAGNQVGGSGMRRGQLKAAGDLQDKLAQMMYQAKQQHQQQRIGGINTLLGRQTVENIYKPGTTGAAQGLVEGFGQGLGQAAGGAAAGGVGSAVKAIAG